MYSENCAQRIKSENKLYSLPSRLGIQLDDVYPTFFAYKKWHYHPPSPYQYSFGLHQSWPDQNGRGLPWEHQIITRIYSGIVHPRWNLFSRLAELVNAQGKRPLAAFWGDGTTSSSDGQNFRTGSSGLYPGQVNPKYGQEPGRQFYIHISDQYSPFYIYINSRVRDSTYLLNGLLYHESGLEIREHYTDTAGFTDHVFALMHLLGFAFCPRIRTLHDKKLFIKRKADQYPALQSLISTTSLNLKEIEIHWREVLRRATSISREQWRHRWCWKSLPATPNKTDLPKHWGKLAALNDPCLCWTGFVIQVCDDVYKLGWIKGPPNALARAVFMYWLDEIREGGLENQGYRASGLTLMTVAIALWNTVYIERTIESLKRKKIPINDQLLSLLSSLGWEHINLNGDYVWRNNLKPGTGKYRPLRTVNIGSYKKQS